MTARINRRQALGSALAGIFTIVPRQVLGGKGYVAPSDRITIAQIGMGTQGFRELGDLLAEPSVQIVAVCDPNKESNDYVEWGKNDIRDQIRAYLNDPSWKEGDDGCPGGREVGRQVVDTYYANHGRKGNLKGCAAYADFRELLTKEQDLDAVQIITPDHVHAAIAIAAMNQGKHVLMHKPIANRLHEGRVVLETARQSQVATHLLAYGSGTANGRIAERVRQGAIGSLREIHNWTNRPVWPQYTQIPSEKPPIPKGLDWDLWLGPERPRAYHPRYTHTVYRGWYDFGGGSMADMGIYSLWPVFTALELPAPLSAEASATHTCTIANNVSRIVNNDFAYPTACRLRFRFAVGRNKRPMDLFWYDGGMQPHLPDVVEAHDVRLASEGIMFVGDEGTILADFRGSNARLFAQGRNKPFQLGEDASPRDRRSLWLAAFQGGNPSPGSFLNAGAITDTVNLGTVALRAGTKVLFDAENMTITNAPAANEYLYREYREGWEL